MKALFLEVPNDTLQENRQPLKEQKKRKEGKYKLKVINQVSVEWAYMTQIDTSIFKWRGC